MDKANKEYILCVDCDGTLIKTDLLHEAILILLKKNPCNLFFMVLWLLRGKSYFKTKIAAYVTFSWDILPYNESVLEIITHAVSEGVKVVLATASPERWAVELSQHLGFFDEVFFTTEYSNCSGDIKGQLLFEKYGRQGFIYAGNSYTDLPVWEYANEGIIVSGDSKLIKKVETVTKILRRIETKRAGFRQYLKAIRIHQWLKNILIFIPAIAAHQYLDIATLKSAVVAFFAFSFCASAGYIINDFFDLESDRRHPNKKKRVFASAAIPIWTGVGMAVFLLGLAVVLSFWVGLYFFLIILCYFILTSLYSFWLKKQVVVDVVLLAGLYTIRIIAGAVATLIIPSFWLLAFSMFLFLSLAVLKRYTELNMIYKSDKRKSSGRGYTVDDLYVLSSIGVSAGMASVMVLALYINNPEIYSLYPYKMWLWGMPPILLYWVSRIWLKAHRGEVDDDPVLFAVKDKQSLLIGVCFIVVFYAASYVAYY